MKELIEALTILSKYGNPDHPTHCEHDILMININPDLVSDEDLLRLEKLGVFISEDGYTFSSYRYGSC